MLTKDLNKIISEITNDQVVSLPTDTVYGLSCNISENAVEKIINLKKRDSSKGFIIISHNYKHLLKYVDTMKLSEEQIKKICTVQEQPTTWIVPGKVSIQWLTGGKPTIAVRLVTTEIITSICSKINDAIISTSANISGRDFINDPHSINEIFNSIYILETEVKSSQPSRIIDIITGDRYR
ncbi:L-threonylcarbamoyladenylate synthase [Francisella philomiragia]|uniref:L-threonylcarbamoyladenylate synthase n=1 Tax=Francisella philomiragia TaxID=28110 RepID=UPI0019087807|nr:Sua5/YciO/YrdC/YwlC family protein [Francisella philomiragia]MBK2105649.1 Sua5/YciO/YrdC/YwlC family protein [Francisella philomiragia]